MYPSSIKKHALQYHPDILSAVGEKSNLLYDTVECVSESPIEDKKVNDITEGNVVNDLQMNISEGIESNGYEELFENYNNTNNEELKEELKEENDQDLIYLQSALSDNVPIMDDLSMSFFLNEDMNDIREEPAE